jgi:predicted RNA-binding protein with PUA-like domain
MATYWLLKTEPGTYSYSDLERDRRTNWNGVRNFQARNHLRKMARGDVALIYHSGDDKAVVGVAEVIKEAYADPDKDGGDWVQVDLKPLRALKARVELARIKTTPALKELPLIRQSRLSVMPITSAHYKTLLKLGGLDT